MPPPVTRQPDGGMVVVVLVVLVLVDVLELVVEPCDGVGFGEGDPGRRAGPPAPGDRVRARLAHHDPDDPPVARDEARLDRLDCHPPVIPAPARSSRTALERENQADWLGRVLTTIP